jgi:hypothetical protein
VTTGSPGLGDEADEHAQELVDPGPHHDPLDGHAAELFRELRADVEGLGVAVPAGPDDLGPKGGLDPGRDAEQALIGAEAEIELPAGAALDGLRPDEGDRGGQAGDDGGVERRSAAQSGWSC